MFTWLAFVTADQLRRETRPALGVERGPAASTAVRRRPWTNPRTRLRFYPFGASDMLLPSLIPICAGLVQLAILLPEDQLDSLHCPFDAVWIHSNPAETGRAQRVIVMIAIIGVKVRKLRKAML